MKILALEFSSPHRSVALACDGVHVREVIESGRRQTMQPFAMIETVLAEGNLERGAIDCLVVGLGPGSYAGIRAGIAVAQGWGLAREVKVAGVSSAEALAAQAQEDGLRGIVNVIIDAQRGEFYLASWELSDSERREREALRIVGAEEVKARAAAGQAIIGPEVARWFPNGRTVYPRAAMVARLAVDSTAFVRGESLEPIYLRETAFVKAPPPRIV
jgi:tRNA threonylcarbamoyladenosine biosynthesis protein TsaB